MGVRLMLFAVIAVVATGCPAEVDDQAVAAGTAEGADDTPRECRTSADCGYCGSCIGGVCEEEYCCAAQGHPVGFRCQPDDDVGDADWGDSSPDDSATGDGDTTDGDTGDSGTGDAETGDSSTGPGGSSTGDSGSGTGGSGTGGSESGTEDGSTTSASGSTGDGEAP